MLFRYEEDCDPRNRLTAQTGLNLSDVSTIVVILGRLTTTLPTTHSACGYGVLELLLQEGQETDNHQKHCKRNKE
jgi:hypothetical protein